MRFFLDENFPATAKALLEAGGHEVIRAADHHPLGTDDQILFAHAQREMAVFLTTDKDFFHTVPFLYSERIYDATFVGEGRSLLTYDCFIWLCNLRCAWKGWQMHVGSGCCHISNIFKNNVLYDLI